MSDIVRGTAPKPRRSTGAVALFILITMVVAVPGRVEAAALPVAEVEPLPRITSVEGLRSRGANYVRLSEVEVNGQRREYHSTFEPGRYTGAEVEGRLGHWRHDGYNTVRVFIDPGDAEASLHGRSHGIGHGPGDWSAVWGPYMDNVADFIVRATAHRIYVVFSLDAFPQNELYYGMVGAVDRSAIDGNNLFYLHPGYVKAKQAYLGNFVAELRNRVGSPLLSTVLAYETDNEAYVDGSRAPFSRGSGVVTTGDGNSYDMASPAQRQQAQDANLVNYARQAMDGARAQDPDALVAMGAFTYHAVGKPGPAGLPVRCDTNCRPDVDYRYPVRLASLTQLAGLSFVDLHIYPDGTAGSLQRNLDSIEWPQVRGPVLLGEFGAFKQFYNGNITTAAYAMRDLQVATCRLGLDGWLFWTWDTTETADQRRLFTLTDSGGAINGQLAPIVRPDPCAR